tara:strand:+ start:9639 stop:10502 length:864 start_codon:yes stop_codon:yes gene_type:complete
MKDLNMKENFTDITVAIITYNEEVNLPFTLRNIDGFAQDVVILDSGSSDNTIDIATSFGARVFHRDFDNFSSQRKHLLNNIQFKTTWILVLDADEILTNELKEEILSILPSSDKDAYFMKRRFYWMGEWVKRGYYPTNLLRLGKVGLINCDDREINEHMICSTNLVGQLNHDFIDQNHKGLKEWVDKHNQYSDREADALFLVDPNSYSLLNGQYSRKRWIRKNIWNNLPPVIRPFFYFFYRFVIKMGFLDGPKVAIYHFLHAFIYRVLIDFKYLEKKWKIKKGRNVK